jgi:hypothetical protein
MKNKEIKGALLLLALVGMFFGAQWVVLILLLFFIYLVADEALGEDTNLIVKMVFGIVGFILMFIFTGIFGSGR